MEKNRARREWGVWGARYWVGGRGCLTELVTFELKAKACESERGRCVGKRNLRQKEQH